MKQIKGRLNDATAHGAGGLVGLDRRVATLKPAVVLAHELLRLAARAGNRRKGRLGILRAHTKNPYKMDFHRKTLRNAKGA